MKEKREHARTDTLTHNQATFTPQLYKSFDGALEAFFGQECPQLGGARTRQVLVQSVRQMVEAFFPATTNLRAGQTIWSAVPKDQKSASGKTITQSRLTPVGLDLLPPDEIQARAHDAKLRDLKGEAVARLFQQAYAQAGVLTNAEVALLLKIAPTTVSTCLHQWKAEHQSQLPRRGTIHDMDPTLTPKKVILEKLLFQGKSVEVVCRETQHSPEAVLRYTTNFKQVLLCRRKGLPNGAIAFATQLSLRLIEEYQALIETWDQQHPQWECSGQPWLDDLIAQLDKTFPATKTVTSTPNKN